MIADTLNGGPGLAPALAVQYAVMREHLLELHQFYGDFAGPRIARKHIGWYLDALAGFDGEKRAFNRLEDPADQLRFLDSLFNQLDRQDLAA
jgi:tRNA-dihydrouridine synthase B